MIVYGFDSGLRSFGWAVADIAMRHDEKLGVHFMAGGVWHTEPDKKAARKGIDQARRTTELWLQLRTLKATFGPAACVCVEAVAFPIGKVQYSVVSGLGRARALVDVFGAELDTRVFEALPTEVKEAVTGNRSAEKAIVCEQLEVRHPEVSALMPRLKGDHEHFADACAVILACQAFNYEYLKDRALRDQEVAF